MIFRGNPGIAPIDEIVGIWDTNISPLNLGGLLMLVEELKIQARIFETILTTISIVGDQADSLLPGKVFQYEDPIVLSSQEACQGSLILSLLLDLDCIDGCYLCSGLGKFQEYLKASPKCHFIWPKLNEQGSVNYKYGSTLFIQKYYIERSSIPHLSCKETLVRWAKDYINRYITPAMPVVVHLKNNPKLTGYSNANFKSWQSFFQSCCGRYNVRFILIGNEPIDPGITQLPNVLVARERGSNLPRDLALIQSGRFFMGMSSGPCIMALFSDIPYVIYKNPDHHAEEMALELGTDIRFPFSSSAQKVLRIYETSENLMSEFVELLAHAQQSSVEAGLAKEK